MKKNKGNRTAKKAAAVEMVAATESNVAVIETAPVEAAGFVADEGLLVAVAARIETAKAEKAMTPALKRVHGFLQQHSKKPYGPRGVRTLLEAARQAVAQ